MTSTDLTSQLVLPADPETPTPAAAPTDAATVAAVPAVAAPVVSAPTVASPTAPTVTVDASGTPHVIIPLTKMTKAKIGTAVAAVFSAGTLATTYLLPDGSAYTHWIQAALGVIGLGATALGIALPTNLPVSFGSSRKH